MSKRVLIVDDSLYMRSLITSAMETAGFEVVGHAENGEQAIDLALSLEPDLITLDNILPDMIGTDILRVLKVEEKIKALVLMVSAVGQESVVNEALALGAADYVVKPFTAESLIESVNDVLDKDVA
jgi:two-component system chemotaxis response regulator CheY